MSSVKQFYCNINNSSVEIYTIIALNTRSLNKHAVSIAKDTRLIANPRATMEHERMSSVKQLDCNSNNSSVEIYTIIVLNTTSLNKHAVNIAKVTGLMTSDLSCLT